MSRYIDADALTKEIEQDIANDGITERYVFYRINEAPSIDIVKCGECSWYEKPSCRWHNIDNKPTDFCSYGERRADD